MKKIVRNKKRLTSDSTMSKIITRVRYAQHIVIKEEQYYDEEDFQ
jgi:hypothetical protein